MSYRLKTGMMKQVHDILPAAGKIIVETNNFMVLL
jgi:hypothetical protein